MSELRVSKSPVQEEGTFSIHRVKESKEKYSYDELDTVLDGDQSLGSRFFGWGIVNHLILNEGQNTLLMLNSDDVVTFPIEGQDNED